MGSGASKSQISSEVGFGSQPQTSVQSNENISSSSTEEPPRDVNTVSQSSSSASNETLTKKPFEQLMLDNDEEQEEIEQMVQSVCSSGDVMDGHSLKARTPEVRFVEPEEVSLAFETFYHNNGTLYTSFVQNGIRVYFDEKEGLVPFPEEWYSQGRFIHANSEVSSDSDKAKSKQMTFVPSPVGHGRTSGFYIPGKGMVSVYIFEERTNVCKYFDAHSGAWLVLPLQWEMNLDFVRHQVQQVKTAHPGLLDDKEIIAALRQCNYNPDEVISIYLAIFGDCKAESSEDHQDETEISFRDLLNQERVIKTLKQKLKQKNRELDNLHLRSGYLRDENYQLSEVVQSLNKKVAELEADQEEAVEKIRALQHVRSQNSVNIPESLPPQPSVEPETVLKLCTLIRELNISNRQLKATVKLKLSEMEHLMNQLLNPILRFKDVELKLVKELKEFRALYRKESSERKLLHNKLLELRGNIRVFCRCRPDPMNQTCLEFPSDEEVIVSYNGVKKRFQFDKVYSPSSSQEEVFEGTLPIITSCVDGYNVCILAYGQTGSGKTYTMMNPEKNPGVNIRSIKELFRLCQERENIKYTMKISMLEIYNETIQDLLSKTVTTHLEIRTQGKMISVPGLTEIDVETEDDIKNVMQLGDKNRTVGSTKMNIESSRSHLMLILKVTGVDNVSGVISNGTLTLCDLAGSERIAKSESRGQRLMEAAAINKSLTSLGQVFTALKTNALHVPYRNSKITHLLQPCLRGDAKACVFINISPDIKDVTETLCTLQFGSSARQVALGSASKHLSPVRDRK